MTEDRQALAGERAPGIGAVPWTVRDAAAGILLVAAGVGIVVGALAFAYRGRATEVSDALVSTTIIVPHLIMVLAVWLLAIRKHGVTWKTAGFARPRRRLSMLLPLPALVASILFGGLYFTLITTLDIEFLLPPSLPAGLLGEGALKLLNITVIGILGPAVEELFFRGFLLAALVNPLGPVRAAAVGSAIFAAAHLNLAVMVPFFASGLLLSWLYLTTRSLWPPIAAHAAQNLLALWVAA